MKNPGIQPPANTVPVFALDADTTWADWENALAASVKYQSSKHGKILPLMFFAPLAEPENPDTWEPMTTVPENLLVCSIERKVDGIILRALKQAEPALGEIRQAASFPAISLNLNLPLADVYRQMTVAGIQAYTVTKTHPDDVSCFFLRGNAAVRAFDKELRKVTSSA